MNNTREKQQYIFIRLGWTDQSKHSYIYKITSQENPSLKGVSHLEENKYELNVKLNASFCVSHKNFCLI